MTTANDQTTATGEQMKRALQQAADAARSGWTDRDIVDRAQTILERDHGFRVPEERLDRFARGNLGWDASRYPADREWRRRIGTADDAGPEARDRWIVNSPGGNDVGSGRTRRGAIADAAETTGISPNDINRRVNDPTNDWTIGPDGGPGFVDEKPFNPPSVPRPHTWFGDLPDGGGHSFQAADTHRHYEACDWRDGGRAGPGRPGYADPSEPGEVVGIVVAWGDGPTEPRDEHERAIDLDDGEVGIVRDFDPDDRILVAGRICARETWTNALNRYLADTPYSVASHRPGGTDPDVRYRFGIARGDEPGYHRMDDVETVIGSGNAATFARGLLIGWRSRG